MTTAPTAAEADELANGDFFNMPNQIFNGSVGEETSLTLFIVSYTQNDTTINGIQLFGDPTSEWRSAEICKGLVSDYGAVTVREYTYDYVAPTDVTATNQITTSLLADSTEQTRVNDPANWVAAP